MTVLRVARAALVAAVVTAIVAHGAGAQSSQRDTVPDETFLQKLLRIAGLTATPSQMKAPPRAEQQGSLWIADLTQHTTSALTSEERYRSPVYAPDGTLYALSGDSVVRVASGAPTGVVPAPAEAAKLVGFDPATPGEVVVLLGATSAGPPLRRVSLSTGTVTPLPYDPTSRESRRLLAQIRSDVRVYGETTVYTRSETKRGLAGLREWTDVYLDRGSEMPVNVSGCDGRDCVQPALSPDGRRVVYVKAKE
jgi:hypothetical protein